MKITTINKLKTNTAFEGEPIETELRSYLEQGQSMEDVKRTHEAIYTQRDKGVIPEFDIRTDRWDIAQGAMDIANKARAEQANAKSARKKGEQAAKTEGNAKPSENKGEETSVTDVK